VIGRAAAAVEGAATLVAVALSEGAGNAEALVAPGVGATATVAAGLAAGKAGVACAGGGVGPRLHSMNR
jgi:hypothetical protein